MKKYKSIKIKKVLATTSNITTAVVNFLLKEGHSASRINVQGQWDERTQSWRKSGSRKGVLDIISCISSKEGKGIAVAIDIKNDGDKLNEDQEDFIEEWESANGIALTANRPDDFIKWYYKQEWIKKKK